MSVVQHKSAVARSANASVTLDSPVTQGNLIAVVVGCSNPGFPSTVSDGVNSYNLDVQGVDSADGIALVQILSAIASESGTLTVTATAVNNEDVHLHVYEISGYTALDRTGNLSHLSVDDQLFETGTSFSISTGKPTNADNELVLAAFFDINSTPTVFTGEAGSVSEQTDSLTGTGGEVFSEAFEVSSIGMQTATATTNSFGDVTAAAIATYYTPGPATATGDDAPRYHGKRRHTKPPARTFRRAA